MTQLNEKILFFNAVYDCTLNLDNKKLEQELLNLSQSPRNFDSGYQTKNVIGKDNLAWFFNSIDPLAFTIAKKWGIQKPIIGGTVYIKNMITENYIIILKD